MFSYYQPCGFPYATFGFAPFYGVPHFLGCSEACARPGFICAVSSGFCLKNERGGYPAAAGCRNCQIVWPFFESYQFSRAGCHILSLCLKIEKPTGKLTVGFFKCVTVSRVKRAQDLYAERRLRPLARRAARILRPPTVALRARKP